MNVLPFIGKDGLPVGTVGVVVTGTETVFFLVVARPLFFFDLLLLLLLLLSLWLVRPEFTNGAFFFDEVGFFFDVVGFGRGGGDGEGVDPYILVWVRLLAGSVALAASWNNSSEVFFGDEGTVSESSESSSFLLETAMIDCLGLEYRRIINREINELDI
jgi:hypothetical protein